MSAIKIKLKNKLSKRQQEIVDYCSMDSLYLYIVVCCGRQVGKTSIGLLTAVSWSLKHPGHETGVFLPTYKQCKNLFNRVKKMLKGLSAINQVTYNGTEFLVTFENGSLIRFHTADNDNCRSFTYDSIIVDEACFVKDEIWNAAIRPTVAVSLSKTEDPGKVLLLSTPKTKNWFHGMVNTVKDTYKVVRFTSEEGGLIGKDYLDDVKRQTPDSIYRNEYLGEFLDAGNGLFRYVQCINNIESNKGVVAGLDLGSKEDYTVLTIQDKDGNLIYLNRWRHQEWDIILKSVEIELRKHGMPVVYVEINGPGGMPFETLRKTYPKTKPWNTSQKSKNDIIQKLILDFNTKNIGVLDIDYLKDELDSFSVEYKNGNAKYEGSNGSHDDCVMSLAICNYNRGNVVKVTPQTFTATIKR